MKPGLRYGCQFRRPGNRCGSNDIQALADVKKQSRRSDIMDLNAVGSAAGFATPDSKTEALSSERQSSKAGL